jgi:S-adenosyl methyltransferase
MAALSWRDALTGPEPLLREVRPGREGVPALLPLVLADQAPGPESLVGALVVAAAERLTQEHVDLLAPAAVVVVVGDDAAAERLRIPPVILVPRRATAERGVAWDAGRMWGLLLERAAAAAARQADELAEVAGHGSADRLLRWCAERLGARVHLLPPGALAGAGTVWGELAEEDVEALARGRLRGPLRGGGTVALGAGDRAPRPVVVVRRVAAPWLAEEIELLEQVAARVGVMAWAREVRDREARLLAGAAGTARAGLQALLNGDLVRAARVLEPTAPGLLTAGAGAVALVECGRGQSRDVLALEIVRAARGQVLAVLPADTDRTVVVALPLGDRPLEEVLRPVVRAAPGRAAGVSPVTPWEQAPAAYRAAVGALAQARESAADRTVVLDRRRPLAERLGADARAWAALVLAPLADLERTERRELLAVGQTGLWHGESEAARLTGLQRLTIRRRLDTLARYAGLDRRQMWQRVALHLAVYLAGLPPSPLRDPGITLEQVLDHPGARQWADEVLEQLDRSSQTWQVLTAWVTAGTQADRAMAALGISHAVLYRHLGSAGAAMNLRLTRPGPAAQAALALAITGAVDADFGSLPDMSARLNTLGGRASWGGVPVGTEPEIDTSRPSAARMLDWWLGGTDNVAADRAEAAEILKINPYQVVTARENRAWVHRAVRLLTGELGLDQYIDLGSGIPTSPALHEKAQELNAAARVVYVDNDASVVALSGRRLQGAAAYLEADFRVGAVLLDRPEITGVIDLDRPAVLCLNSALHFIEDNSEARALVRSLTSRLAPGSYVTISHITPDFAPDVMAALVRRYRGNVTRGGARTRDEIAALVAGMELLEPGIVSVADWRRTANDLQPAPSPEQVNLYGLVARIG